MLDIIVDFEHKQKGTVMIDRHHLLECILWPNGDGTFRKIINRAERLQELGIYDDYKLTIPLDKSTHQTLHREFEKGTEYERIGDKNGMYGRTGKNAPMYGIARNLSATWKGDKAGPGAMYHRAIKLYKAGEITEEEFRPFRDAWAERSRNKRKRMKNRSSSV
jgi:hypothetical protein